MVQVSVTEARSSLPALVQQAQQDAVILDKHGEPVAVLISPQAYEAMLEALEDADDVAAFDVAMAEEGPNVPWEQVKIDLGLA